MSSRGDLLPDVMLETSTTQSELSRVSGVHQPSISQFLSGKVELSDEQLDRLLSCMGYRLEVVRRRVMRELTRSERRSWRLHRQLSTHLTRTSLEQWWPTIERNLERLCNRVSSEPHGRNLDRWMSLDSRSSPVGVWTRKISVLPSSASPGRKDRNFVAALLEAGFVNAGVIHDDARLLRAPVPGSAGYGSRRHVRHTVAGARRCISRAVR
jgi:transcriptional regulator with XRE-family HTH domain